VYRRPAVAEIDYSAIEHNVRTLKALTSPGTLFEAVVKADGYGHGGVETAKAAVRGGADRLGLATVDEALELKGSGVTKPMHLLSEPPMTCVGLLAEHDIIPSVATREFAAALGNAAASAGTTARYHLIVDTGMSRMGVPHEDAADLALSLKDFPGLELEGTMTHFATAETPGDWDFERQLQRFAAVLERMHVDGVDPGIVHAANTGATVIHPESHFDMVRCGIGIYGLHPGEATKGAVDLHPAMSVRTEVSLVKRIQMGEGVSYGLTWRAAAPTTIATLPVGYADGIHRVLSDRMSVLIGGQRCRQVGRVTMDQIMVEVPSGLAVSSGDEAVVVGSQGSSTITMDEVAQHAETINYEMACAFGTMRLVRTRA
jgi:alanine racemase